MKNVSLSYDDKSFFTTFGDVREVVSYEGVAVPLAETATLQWTDSSGNVHEEQIALKQQLDGKIDYRAGTNRLVFALDQNKRLQLEIRDSVH